MTRDKALLAAMLGGAVMAAPTVSMAQARSDTGWYVGASVGQSKARHFDCSGFSSCDTKAAAFGVLGGYRINRNFAAELGYHDFGRVTFSAPGVSGNIKANAAELVGLGAYPFANQFSVYGKLGAYRAESKISAPVAGLGSGSLKDRNTDLTFGLGAQYDVTRGAGVRAEWQRYKNVGGDDTGGKSDIDVISIGLIWRFH
jgi:OmpA-OmpF porin, OOP family